ncbi:hypothetical protein X425_00812 [Mycobacterium numidiamassiliense]|jgi:hypothetical protein|uniref:DUF732 domain-containing protein n=1 Tax=Mycobacterium numidiamassiliense TaxID=1841861 RepID=A0A2U3PCN7_9MYCO|nr:hypothetical protein X425_00812 [Mycobacterium numidiamassiliense]
MSVRGLRLLCIPAAIAAVLTAGSGVATADDDGYLAQLKKIGVVWQPGGDSTLISLGHAICSNRAAGQTPDQLAADVHSGLNSSFSYADATAIVSAAESNYCP